MDDVGVGHGWEWGDDSSPSGSSGEFLNSIGAVNSDTTDLERIFTKEGLCAFCSSPLRIEGKNK